MILGESGEAALITYDNTVDLRQEFISDSDLIEKSSDELDELCETLTKSPSRKE